MALTLASTSTIRRHMLEAAGIDFDIARPDVDEDVFKAQFNDPPELAAKLAEAKAISAAGKGWVIGSDSVVRVDGRLFDKPRDRADARDHLRFFSGRRMLLTSAVALANNARAEWGHVEMATLSVRTLSDGFIDDYLDSEWPEVGYTVGVFRLEARGVQLFDRIEGDHFSILGMPLIPLLGALRERGLLPA